ncbi:hypothetical protein [Bradyrhizobium prioriisuperbiae]|uniref:hypothetical protein n=1 Tax=Bradyrhizobium prioriisuperbiae TaxID=2854389 RepID=UPI0028E5A598|nr:hypothetical protein [Bradyrhizobium prioritasuperba]
MSVVMRWDPTIRNDVTESEWLEGVKSTWHYLIDLPPNTTSLAIINAIRGTGKKITIVPEPKPYMPDKSDANAHADPVNPQAATRPGGTPEGGTNPGSGTGGGSDVVLAFVAQDWDKPSAAASLRAADETLLHELVHAMRQAQGLEDTIPLEAPFAVLRKGSGSISSLMSGEAGPTTKYSQIYNEYEEFVAIVITNIYRSEAQRIGLKRDHLGEKGKDAELRYPLTNPRNFLTVWRTQLEQMSREMPRVCGKLAEVRCAFNPISELYASRRNAA